MRALLTRFFIRVKTHLTESSLLLLLFLFITIFILPALSFADRNALSGTGYTAIFILSALSVVYYQKRIALFALSVILMEWISVIFSLPLVYKITLPVKFIFFLIIVMIMIVQIARSEKVTRLVLLQAINVYLLIGLCFAVIVVLVDTIDPQAFTLQSLVSSNGKYLATNNDFVYFTIVTLTSTGYGDILPVSAAAKALSNLISITGQLYIAIIIAMLVGKYSSK